MPGRTVNILMNRPMGHPDIPFKTKTGNEVMKRRFDTVAARRAYGNSNAIAKRHLSKAMSRLVEQGIYLPMAGDMIAGELAASGIITDLQIKDNEVANLSMTPLTDSVANLKDVDDVEDMRINKPTYDYNDRILGMMKRRVNAARKDDRTDAIGMFNALREQDSANKDIQEVMKLYHQSLPKDFKKNDDPTKKGAIGSTGGGGNGGMGPGGGGGDDSTTESGGDGGGGGKYAILPTDNYWTRKYKEILKARGNGMYNGVPPQNNPNSASFQSPAVYVPTTGEYVERDMYDDEDFGLDYVAEKSVHGSEDSGPNFFHAFDYEPTEVNVGGHVVQAPSRVSNGTPSLSSSEKSIMSRDGGSVADGSVASYKGHEPLLQIESGFLRATNNNNNNRVSHNDGNVEMTNNRDYNNQFNQRNAFRAPPIVPPSIPQEYSGMSFDQLLTALNNRDATQHSRDAKLAHLDTRFPENRPITSPPVAEPTASQVTNAGGRITNNNLMVPTAEKTPATTADATTDVETVIQPVKTENPVNTTNPYLPNFKILHITRDPEAINSNNILTTNYMEYGYAQETFDRLVRLYARDDVLADKDNILLNFFHEFRKQEFDTPAYKAYLRFIKWGRPDVMAPKIYNMVIDRHNYLKK